MCLFKSVQVIYLTYLQIITDNVLTYVKICIPKIPPSTICEHSVDVLQLLLENGAEVDEVCDDGQTALEHATSNIEMVFLTENTGEVENILIKHGAK
tara:strand:+ start:1391 stop:1681 length:291 start_codon:yes stop_codon:yes gene_type:complete